MEIKWIMIANAVMWLSVALAVFGAIYLTGKIVCLWFIIVPLFGGYKYSCTTDTKNSNEVNKDE